jgi:hypothetical protein
MTSDTVLDVAFAVRSSRLNTCRRGRLSQKKQADGTGQFAPPTEVNICLTHHDSSINKVRIVWAIVASS